MNEPNFRNCISIVLGMKKKEYMLTKAKEELLSSQVKFLQNLFETKCSQLSREDHSEVCRGLEELLDNLDKTDKCNGGEV